MTKRTIMLLALMGVMLVSVAGIALAEINIGSGGNDVLLGEDNKDIIRGGGGNDTISGDDSMAGGVGDVINSDDNAPEAVNCGDGRDRVNADDRDVVQANCEIVR